MKTKLLLLSLLIGSISFAQYTGIPDPNFENALSAYDDIANDGQVPTANINTITTLDVHGQNISDLTGIEDFTALTILGCYDNQLTNLDISQNINLSQLNCVDNQLTSLDVSQNINLIELSCSLNQLTSLDVSQNTNLIWLACLVNQITSLDVSQNLSLEQLDCNGNQLTNLDVSQNANLTQLGCAENQLTSLDVSQNTNLFLLNCYHNQLTSLNVKNGNNINIAYFNTLYNPDLTCIEVDDVAYSNANWTNINVTSSFSLDCSTYGLTYVPDDNFENYLETHDANGNTVALGDPTSMGNGLANDDYITTANINMVINLDVQWQNIADLTGIEDFTLLENLNAGYNNLNAIDVTNNVNLKVLQVYYNNLNSIDVSNLHLLETFHCAANNITVLDVSNNPLLALFRCQANNLTTLDVSQNPQLYQLFANENDLSSLNVKNGNNTNITGFIATNNPNLLCIEVDDPAYSTANWTNIDPQTNYNHNCTNPETYIPDNQFEYYLEVHDADGNIVIPGPALSMGNGIINDGYVTTSKIAIVTDLDLFMQNIYDLTGIEDFTALTNLSCNQNHLTSLDVSQNLALERLVIDYNQIQNLDVSNNLALHYLSANYNALTSLDVSNNSNLQALFCPNNQLNNLVFNPNLEVINVSDNQLTNLNFDANTQLADLYLVNNPLTALSLQNGNNTNIVTFDTTDTPNLTCIYIDDATYSSTNWTNIDAANHFVETTVDCNALGVTDNQLNQKIALYPNPVNHILNISAQDPIENISIYNVTGQEVMNIQANATEVQVDMSQLQNDIYFVKAQIKGQVSTFKVVKE